jgi:hypothetical protein
MILSGQGLVRVVKADGSAFGYVANQANAYGEYGVTTNASEALVVVEPWYRTMLTSVRCLRQSLQCTASHKSA